MNRRKVEVQKKEYRESGLEGRNVGPIIVCLSEKRQQNTPKHSFSLTYTRYLYNRNGVELIELETSET